jgi:hypothetical protein
MVLSFVAMLAKRPEQVTAWTRIPLLWVASLRREEAPGAERWFIGCTTGIRAEGKRGPGRHGDANGVSHAYYRPLNQAARDAIEAQVLGALRSRGVLR